MSICENTRILKWKFAKFWPKFLSILWRRSRQEISLLILYTNILYFIRHYSKFYRVWIITSFQKSRHLSENMFPPGKIKPGCFILPGGDKSSTRWRLSWIDLKITTHFIIYIFPKRLPIWNIFLKNQWQRIQTRFWRHAWRSCYCYFWFLERAHFSCGTLPNGTGTARKISTSLA